MINIEHIESIIIPTSGTTGEQKYVQIGRNAPDTWLKDFWEMHSFKEISTVGELAEYVKEMIERRNVINEEN